jgi:glycosyltransferase involved in cell wall biosynthesis
MLFSIVTPSFNQAGFLVRTADSILKQAGDFQLQWIVVDGGSTDGTINLLRSLDDPRVTWISEPDRGQAHAVNKGLARADGDIIGWLNSDDLYAAEALATVAGVFAANPSIQWAVGRCEMVNADDVPIRQAITRYKDRSLRRFSYRALLRQNFISQPAVFWRREFGEHVGPLDESLHWTMDYDLWLRMGRLADPLIVPKVLAKFRLHGQSKSGRVERGQFDEQYRVASRYFAGDRVSRAIHRVNVEKIVWSYRLMRLLKR